MTSKNLSFKLVRDEARRNIWALALSILGFLFAAPLPVVIFIQQGFSRGNQLGLDRAEAVEQMLENLPHILCEVFPRLGLVLMAAICGIALFRFLHDRRQVDFYHALPIRRETLYAAKFLTGLLLVLPAYLAARLLAVVIAIGAGLGSAIVWGDLFVYIGVDLLSFFVIYGISILCTVVCGNTICAIVLNGWALFSLAVVKQIYEFFAYTFYPTHAINDISIWYFSPVLGVLDMEGELQTMETVMLAVYMAAGIAALALSFVLFRIRRSERAGKAIAFEPFKLPLKVYVCMVAGMAFGGILSSIFGYSVLIWMLLFTAVGTAVCHCVMEAIYDADIRSAFHHLPMLAVVTAASLALTAGLKADIFGYSKWLPKESSVEWVELYNLYTQEKYTGTNIGRYYGFSSDERLTDPAVVQSMLRLTELGVENLDLLYAKHMSYYDADMEKELQGENGFYDITIRYGLPFGREKLRFYSIPITDESTELLNSVLYSEDYLFWHNQAFRFAENMKEYPELEPVAVVTDCLRQKSIQTLRDSGQVNALVKAVQADAVDATPEQAAVEGPVFTIELSAYFDETKPVGSRVRLNNQVAVYPSYQRTLALLAEYADIVPQPLSVEEVSSVRIADNRDRGEDGADSWFTVSDPDEIARLLEGAVANEDCDRYGLRVVSGVEVMVTLMDGNVVYLSYRVETIPEDLLTEHLGSPLVDENAASGAEYPLTARA